MTRAKNPPTRDPSINAFCRRKGISRETFNNWDRRGCAPRTVQVIPGARRIITPEEEAAWELRYMAPTREPETAA